MREAIGAGSIPLGAHDHLLQPVLERAERRPQQPMLAHRSGDRFAELTTSDVVGRMRALAKGLVAIGVAPGDRVGLMSRTRYEWVLADYGVLAAGAVTVPIYETSSADQVEWILADSGAVAVIVETDAMRRLFERVVAHTPACRHVFVIDAGGLDDLAAQGAEVPESHLDQRLARIHVDDPATIIYTSGTTGRPKGCLLTHRNLRMNARQSLDAVADMVVDGDRGILFLPLAHSLTKVNFLVGAERGLVTAFATDLAHLPEELPLARPTLFTGVPRVFEKVYGAAQQQARRQHTGAVFDLAASVASRWSEEETARRTRAGTRLAHAVFDRLVYRRLRDAFGGSLRFAFSGGGPLGERLTHFYNGVGVKVLEGYGLTETSPTLTVNTAEAWKPGTVGRPVAGTRIRIADDGEVLAQGPQVFCGYWNNPEATAEVFTEDGWFCTGDIGELDEDGFLRITGRKKDILVTAGGKNVAPAPLEDRIRAHPLVSQALVVGDGRPYIAALVTLDEEAVADWAETHGRAGASVPDLVDDPALQAEIGRAIQHANSAVSHAEAVKRFTILPRDLLLEADELTPTLKVRRARVLAAHADDVERLYAA